MSSHSFVGDGKKKKESKKKREEKTIGDGYETTSLASNKDALQTTSPYPRLPSNGATATTTKTG